MLIEKVKIENTHGIHCRPSAEIIKAVASMTSVVEVKSKNGNASLRSMIELLSLGLECGNEVTIEVSGDNELADMARLKELFTYHFDFKK